MPLSAQRNDEPLARYSTATSHQTPHNSLLRRYSGAWGANSRHALVALENRPVRRGEIDNVECSNLGPRVADLNRGITDDGVLTDKVLADCGRDVDAVSVTSDQIGIDVVTAGVAHHADSEIVRGVDESVTVRSVQPDPAVVAGQSYAAARLSGNAGPVANGSVPFDERPDRGGQYENTGTAVGGNRQSFEARVK